MSAQAMPVCGAASEPANLPTCQSANDLSVIIVNWNTRDLLADCLRSIHDTVHDLEYEVFVVDNASTDGSVAMVREQFPAVHLIENSENVGFARANNQAMIDACGDYFVLLNSDTVALPGALTLMHKTMESCPTIGILGCQLLNADGSLQHSYADYPTFLTASLGKDDTKHVQPFSASRALAVDAVSGACMMARRDVWRSIGGMDEGYWLFAEEMDWCYRARKAGWDVCTVPDARIVHLIGASRRQAAARTYVSLHRSRLKFFRDHYGIVASAALQVAYTLIGVLKYVRNRAVWVLTRSDDAAQAAGRNRALLAWLFGSKALDDSAGWPR